jgi:glycosyltransferase involved in cell wall biosynthesis
MSGPPVVSIILPCFNAERSLGEALASVVNQTYEALEILVLDDGSTDSTLGILQEHARGDARIRVLRNAQNLGLIPALNRCVAEARGRYIARMDADDIAAPERIELQAALLAARPEIGVVGSAASYRSVDGRVARPRPVRCIEPEDVRFMALLGTPIIHPTLMGRAEVMRAHPYGLSADSLYTEDYELFARMLEAGIELANLPESLLTVRIDPSGVSLSHEQLQIANFVKCARRHLEHTLRLTPDIGAHRVLVNRMDRETTPGDLRQGLALLSYLEQVFLDRRDPPNVLIHDIANMQRADILIQAILKGAPRLRLDAVRLTSRYGRRLLSPRTRSYLATKLTRDHRQEACP